MVLSEKQNEKEKGNRDTFFVIRALQDFMPIFAISFISTKFLLCSFSVIWRWNTNFTIVSVIDNTISYNRRGFGQRSLGGLGQEIINISVDWIEWITYRPTNERERVKLWHETLFRPP